MKRILIIGVGWEQIPLVKKAKEKGLYVIATTWWDKQQIPADKIYEADSRDLEMLEQIVQKEKPDYVTADECDYSAYAVAYLAEKYNMYGPGVLQQTISNNKFLQREYVSKSDVLQPEYKLCWGVEQAKVFANKIGYPVMVKPIDNRGSIGISKVYDETDMDEAWLFGISHSHSRMCIVEKCIIGDTVIADGFCDSEGYEFIAASNKDMYEQNDNVAKVVYYPGEFDEKTWCMIKNNAETIAHAMKLDFGFVHTEFIVEKSTGNVYFVECANRGGGVYISNTVLESITGIDYCDALLRLSMGEKCSCKCRQQYYKKCILYFMVMQGDMSITEYIKQQGVLYKIIHMNACKEMNDVTSAASAGRAGVIVLEGESFDELVKIGRTIEISCKQEKQEVFMM